MFRHLLNNRGATTLLESMYVIPIILVLLLGIPEVGFYIVDSQVVNAAVDQALRQTQIDGYFSDAARAIAEAELRHAVLLVEYEISGTSSIREWGETVEVTISSTRTLYVLRPVEVSIRRTASGLSEHLP